MTEAQLLEAERGVRQGMLKTFPGFVARELFRGEGGEWFVVLRFSSRERMLALLEALKVSPDASFQAFGALIDRSTMRVELADQAA